MVPKVAGSKSSRFAEIRGSVAEASRDVAGFFSASRKRRGSVAERRGASRGQTYYPFGVLVDRNKPNGKKVPSLTWKYLSWNISQSKTHKNNKMTNTKAYKGQQVAKASAKQRQKAEETSALGYLASNAPPHPPNLPK